MKIDGKIIPPIFFPKPHSNESIGSISLRACGAHGMRLSSFIEATCGTSLTPASLFIPAIEGRETPLNSLCHLQNWAAPPVQTSLLHLGKFGKWITYKFSAFCPLCANHGHLPWIHDFKLIEVCQIHGCNLVNECSSCKRRIDWDRRGINQCRCGSILEESSEASCYALSRGKYIETQINSNKFDRLEITLKVERTLIDRYEIYADLFEIDRFIQGDVMPLLPYFKEVMKNLGNLPAIAITAPLAKLGVNLKKIVANLSNTLSIHHNSRSTTFNIPGFYLTSSELSIALGTKKSIADSLTKIIIDSQRSRSASGKSKITPNLLEKFYRNLSPSRTKITDGKFDQINKSIPEMIKAIYAGESQVISYDHNRPLRYIQVISARHLPDHMSMAETVDYLGTYLEAVRNLSSMGFLNPIRKHGRYWFSTKEVLRFHKQYALIGELTKAVDTTDRRFSEKLMSLGAHPVSGPLVDGGLICIFHRKDVRKSILNRASKVTDYATNSGRNPLICKARKKSEYVDLFSTSALLGISTGKIGQFETNHLLVIGYPKNSSSRGRHYLRSSISRTARFIKSLRSASEISREIRTSVRNLMERYRLLCRDPVFKPRDNEIYLTPQTEKILKHHFNNYWDASTVSKYLGVTKTDVNNWRKLKHLTTIERGTPGYIPGIHLYRPAEIRDLLHSDFLKSRHLRRRRKNLRY